MRLRRITLRNFKGVAAASVDIPAEGVTVIEGPNEAGKSSLAEAVDLIIEYLDSSGAADVKAAQPIGVDAGPEVEIELTIGAYHLVYRKRWLKHPETVLRILAPQPEQLSGRAAHERVKEILDRHVDLGLWRALRYEQGVELEQAAVGNQRSLLAALDEAAAGQGRADRGQAEGLWSRVRAEREQYFTATGRLTAERNRLAARLEAARATVAGLARELADLDAAAENHRRLTSELRQLAGRLAAQGQAVREQGAAWNEIQALQDEVKRLEAEVGRAEVRAEKAEAAHQKRRDLIEQLRLAGEVQAGWAERARQEAPGLEGAAAAVAEAQGRREEARRARLAAEQAESQARQDLEHFDQGLSLEMLLERLGRVQAAEQEQREAQAFLEGCPIDAARLEEIEQAFMALTAARAGLSAESAAVRVEALGATEVEVDGRRQAMAAGEVREAAVTGSLEVAVPGVVRVTVTGGARTREMQHEVAEAARRLDALHAAVGVSGEEAQAQARDLERRRLAAVQAAEQAARALQDNLRDLTPQVLAEKVERAQSRLTGYLSQRPVAPALPAGRDEAKAIAEAAAGALQAAREALEQRDLELRVAEEALGQVKGAALEREVRAQAAGESVAALAAELAAEREAAGDEDLARALAAARELLAAARQAHQAAAASLQSRNPEEAAALLENAREVLARMEQDRQAMELERAAVTGLLESRGETGLQERLDAAASEVAGLDREKEQTDRRADAVDLLYRTLGEHRDAAKRSYLAPFREKLESFGRIVFGPEVSFEIDPDSLDVVSRTLDGVTVPYAALSAGAREQLCLMGRLAGAVLVSRPESGDPGVPVIIDDALGNSDAARLERLGAVLGMAGRLVQVIVLTCVPDRYRNVGAATVRRLPAGGGAGPEGNAAGAGPATLVGVPPPAGTGMAAAPPAPGPGEGASGEEQVLACLRAAGAPLGRSEIIARTGLPEALWSRTIASLVEQGRVAMEGAKRGARYRLSGG